MARLNKRQKAALQELETMFFEMTARADSMDASEYEGAGYSTAPYEQGKKRARELVRVILGQEQVEVVTER